MSTNLSKIKPYIPYLVAGCALWYIVSRENEDMWIDPKNKAKKGDGYSKNYMYGEGSKKDDVESLLDKIEWLTHFESRTVKWRRFMLTALIITGLISLFIIKRPLSGTEILSFVFIIYIVLFTLSNFYIFHYERYPEVHIRDNVMSIRDRLNLKKKLREFTGLCAHKDCE